MSERARSGGALTAAATAMLAGLVACSSSSSPQPTAPSSAAPPTHSPSQPPPAGEAARHLVAQVLSMRLPGPLSRSVVFADGRSLLICGGLANGDRSVSQVLRATPSDGAIAPVGALTVAVHDAAGAVLSGRRVVVGGGAAHEVNVVQTCPTAGLGHAVGRLPVPSSDLVTAESEQRAYAVGGYDGTRAETAVLATTDGVHFHLLGHLEVGVRYAAAVIGPDALWVFGGDVNRRATATVQRVNLSNGKVTRARPLPSALSHASVVVVDGVPYLAGGRTSSGAASSTIWQVDARTGVLTRVGRLPEALSDAGAASLGSVGYLVGGENSGRLTTVVQLRMV